MVRLGIIAVIGAIIVSMSVAMVFFIEYQPNLKEVDLGEQIQVGPIKYILSYQGIEKGNKEIKSNSTFMKIGIIAEDLKGQVVTAEKKQFLLLDKNRMQTQPTHGTFVEESPEIIAYFPLEDENIDEEFQYKIMIRPTKDQKSTDLGFVCITNCE